MRILKRLIRRVLPARVHGVLRRAIHAWRLARVPAMAADVAPLPHATEISFSDLLCSEGLAHSWERAKKSIDEIFEYVPRSHAADPESCRTIYHLIRRLQPHSVLEIGTNGGASTLHAAMAMRDYRRADRPPGLVTVDMFDVNDPATAEAKRYRITTPPRERLARLDCADMVEFSIASSTDFLTRHKAAFDFILLDHAPRADTAYRDIVLAIGALRPGGQLLMHSYFPGKESLGTAERVNADWYLAVRRLRRQGIRLVALPLGPLPWPAKAGGPNLTSLALLARE